MISDPVAWVAIGAMIVASWTDVRTGRIPNEITLVCLVFAVGWHGVRGDVLLPWLGAAVAFAMHYPLWMLGVERGGDAKLMIGFGALMGWATGLEATLWYGAVYLPIGFLILLFTGRLSNVKRVFADALWRRLDGMTETDRTSTVGRLQQMGVAVPERPEGKVETTPLRTAPILLVAGVLAMATDLLRLVG